MRMLRLTGQGGVQIYDLDGYSKEEAREDYLNETGYEANKISHKMMAFEISGKELVQWVNTGEI